ncbi:hypothetical protein ACFE04_011298 [Oxalis oulophora]
MSSAFALAIVDTSTPTATEPLTPVVPPSFSKKNKGIQGDKISHKKAPSAASPTHVAPSRRASAPSIEKEDDEEYLSKRCKLKRVQISPSVDDLQPYSPTPLIVNSPPSKKTSI